MPLPKLFTVPMLRELPPLLLSNKALVNTSAEYRGTLMGAITKMKRLLNELSYLVMATTANAFIYPCLVVCVRIASVYPSTEQSCIPNQ